MGPFHSTPLFFSFGIFAVLVICCPQLSDAQTTALPWEKLTALPCELGPRTRRKSHLPFQENCCVHLCLGEICSFHYGCSVLTFPQQRSYLTVQRNKESLALYPFQTDTWLSFCLPSMNHPFPEPSISCWFSWGNIRGGQRVKGKETLVTRQDYSEKKKELSPEGGFYYPQVSESS